MFSDISKRDALIAVSAVSETNIFERMKVYCKSPPREKHKNMQIEDDAIRAARCDKFLKKTVIVTPDDVELRRISESSSPVVCVERNPAIEEKLEQFRFHQLKETSLLTQAATDGDDTSMTSSTVSAEYVIISNVNKIDKII